MSLLSHEHLLIGVIDLSFNIFGVIIVLLVVDVDHKHQLL